MITNYFKLQYRLLLRQVRDTGVHPFVALLLFILILIICDRVLLQYPQMGAYTLVLSIFQILFRLSDAERNDFLKNLYNKRQYFHIRLTENFITSTPTLLLLLLHKQWILTAVSIVFILLFVSVRLRRFARSIPTPFRKFPFEFIIGFRQTYLLLLLIYALGVLGMIFGNPNLSLFCIACVAICTTFYYQTPEPIFYLWNHIETPALFLFRKMKRGFLQLLVLCLPLIIAFATVFPQESYQVLIVLIGLTFLIPFIITLKYSAYPRQINFPEAFTLAICLSFYPLILALMPFYYAKALKNLKNYL